MKYEPDVPPLFCWNPGKDVGDLSRPVDVNGQLRELLVHEDDLARCIQVVGELGEKLSEGESEELLDDLFPVFVDLSALRDGFRPPF